MKINQLHLNLLFGKKKGFIYTYDALIAGIILTIILFTSTYYISIATADKLSKVQTTNVASDTIRILIQSDALKNLDETEIQKLLESIIPDNYKMNIEITRKSGTILFFGQSIPDNVFISSGKVYSVTNTNEPLKIDYKIWQDFGQ